MIDTAIDVRVQRADFDVAEEYRALLEDVPRIGACVLFTGLVRDLVREGDHLQGMFLEHYPGMTEKSLAETAREASQRWPLMRVKIIHRVGQLAPGDQIVLVVVSSEHREAAFAAGEFVMDILKTSAPFWKKEVFTNRESWVDARDSDDRRARRWREKPGD